MTHTVQFFIVLRVEILLAAKQLKHNKTIEDILYMKYRIHKKRLT